MKNQTEGAIGTQPIPNIVGYGLGVVEGMGSPGRAQPFDEVVVTQLMPQAALLAALVTALVASLVVAALLALARWTTAAQATLAGAAVRAEGGSKLWNQGELSRSRARP